MVCGFYIVVLLWLLAHSGDPSFLATKKGAERLIVGTGQSGLVELPEEAAGYLRRQGCRVELLPTPEAIQVWNSAEGAVIGLFHITCDTMQITRPSLD